jgi:hypothetical protein
MQAIDNNNPLIKPIGTEPPILGAPILFELIRSYNILNEKNRLGSNRAKLHANDPSLVSLPSLNNNIERGNILLVNPTNYNGFYYRKGVPFNFVRNSIVNSNPYVLLTQKDIADNAKGIENEFTSLRDTSKIKNAIDEYWNRIMLYDEQSKDERKINVDLQDKYLGYYPGFHLIYAYLLENTKMFQIFERIISLYQHGEDLTIPYNKDDLETRSWIENSFLLFFSNSPYSICNDNSLLGSNFEAMRRNGYYRLFGMDLNHGIGENGTTPIAYKRANHYNADFISQFENFLKLCWQMMINFNNTGNINTTDLIAIQEQANNLKSMLLSRRTTENDLENYTYLNLSKLEFQSVIMAEWFNHAISYNSPIVREMGAEAVTPGERLKRLSIRVGISPPSKTSNFIDLAPLMATFLRLIELDEVDNDYIAAIANPATMPYTLISTILHNYQLATGKDLKNQVMVNNNYLMGSKIPQR